MDRHFATYSKITISSRDFQRLSPGRWLNDNIIELYSQWLLAERTAANIRKQVHIFSPFFYAKITQKTPSWNLLRRQARRVAGLECLIVPVCVQSYWRLFIIAQPYIITKQGAIFAIDSLPGYPNEPIATNLRRYLEFFNMTKYKCDINTD